MSSLKIRKVGNSLGVIFSKEIQETLNVSEGDLIDVTTLPIKLFSIPTCLIIVTGNSKMPN